MAQTQQSLQEILDNPDKKEQKKYFRKFYKARKKLFHHSYSVLFKEIR